MFAPYPLVTDTVAERTVPRLPVRAEDDPLQRENPVAGLTEGALELRPVTPSANERSRSLVGRYRLIP